MDSNIVFSTKDYDKVDLSLWYSYKFKFNLTEIGIDYDKVEFEFTK